MLLKIEQVDKKRFLHLVCDHCKIEFQFQYNAQKEKRFHHFCKFACAQAARGKNGVLRPIMEETMRKKMGDDWASQIGHKANATLTAEQRKVRGQKAKKTVLERYGANSATQIPHVRAAADAVRGSPENVAKQKAACFAKFGVESVLSLPHIHALANTPEKCRQRHETMKRNGSYFNSKTEHKFYMFLVERYGEKNVDRQAIINKWPIDFYIKSTKTYVQFDGKYWHGLDRELSDIALFKTPRDKTILRKYQIDREQDAWFKANQIHFIRITDEQFEHNEVAQLPCNLTIDS